MKTTTEEVGKKLGGRAPGTTKAPTTQARVVTVSSFPFDTKIIFVTKEEKTSDEVSSAS